MCTTGILTTSAQTKNSECKILETNSSLSNLNDEASSQEQTEWGYLIHGFDAEELLPLPMISAWPLSGWARLIPTHLMAGTFLEQDLNHYTGGSQASPSTSQHARDLCSLSVETVNLLLLYHGETNNQRNNIR